MGKSRGQKIGELIDALDNGNILYKEYEVGEKQFVFKTGNPFQIEAKGWCSAYGVHHNNKIVEVIEEPDNWKIFPNFNMNTDDYPFPWSSTWEEKET